MNDVSRDSLDFDTRLSLASDIVKSILRLRTRMSLRDDDMSAANQDALDLYQDALARVWERIAGTDGEGEPVADVKAFAAVVTYNVWNTHLRRKHPRRTSLANRLTYFLGHHRKFARWQGDDNQFFGGFAHWQLSGAPCAPARRVAALISGETRLTLTHMNSVEMDRFTSSDWDRLLTPIFERLGGPLDLNDLTGVVARVIQLQEDSFDSIDDGDEEGGVLEPPDLDMQPHEIAEQRSLLTRLWTCVLELRTEHRRAYLLNVPGPGKTRGDIEVFVLHGVASIADIGHALALADAQYRWLFTALDMEPDDRKACAALASGEECFYMVWKYLPLADVVIAQLLGIEQQKVINRRLQAMKELARGMR
jgi:RNA polymerase sigma factor (sigma-70 family)